MKKIIEFLVNKYKGPHPCKDEYACIVRPACHLLHKKPWRRSSECPEYKEYCRRKDAISTVKDKIIDWFWIVLILSVFLLMLVTFILGLVKWGEIIMS